MNGNTTLSNIAIGFLSGAAGALVVIALGANALVSDNVGFLERLTQQLANPGQQNVIPEYEPATDHETLVMNAVQKASPAVVSVVISKDIPVVEQYYESDPFDSFFDIPLEFRMPQYRENGTERRDVGGGSGFLVSEDGLIITNRHVVEDTEADYTVFTNDGKKYAASIVARDPVHDLAILRVEGSGFPFLSFTDSQDVQVGQTAIAIGNALAEFRNSVSVGVISGLSRSITAGDSAGRSEVLDNVIQTDAAINPGNSGGPLLNLRGEVIGVNVAVASGSENIGFALPGNIAKRALDSVRATGRIVRPILGVRYVMIDDALKSKNLLSVDYGALVVRGETSEDLAVIPGSPADKAGLTENDIILEVNNIKLDTHTLASLIRDKNVGDAITLKILHKGEEKTLTVTLEETPQ